ncbi:MAG: SAM-dependent methyltransferase [Trichlorobacter sp.]|uniref:class I SAM-dependent methyltransferase n=1 Tax=Trichlorobacter sp. TaxID=2911007 RepID=UPI00256DB092|nr:SAM-dependent methyltransferase [Trichlorobacter sp.]MDK9716538.1 SAM-dependent methyltransferase [Trichlorobacter sp.]
MTTMTLDTIIADRIRATGRMTFADYMTACLYEPGLGYYTSPGRKVGTEGDFYTSITVHATFGRVIAREIAAMWRSMCCPTDFTLVEVGAGHGRLACDIMDFLAEQQPDCYAATKLVLVEQEPSLAEAQAALLAKHGDKLSWLSPTELPNFRFSGVLYSNELLDAMPVHRVLMAEQGLKEIYVTLDGDQLQDLADVPSTPALEAYLERFGIPLHPGQEAEVSLAGLSWFENVAECLQNGFILTIDYGWAKAELYSPQRNLGTLLCYYKHTVEDNPYQRLGQQDITTHINFSALIERGEELGLKPLWFGEQSRFLLAAGVIEELEAIEASDLPEKDKLKLRLTIKRLIMPEGGMGDTFRVLVQSKGVAEPKLGCLRGISL